MSNTTIPTWTMKRISSRSAKLLNVILKFLRCACVIHFWCSWWNKIVMIGKWPWPGCMLIIVSCQSADMAKNVFSCQLTAPFCFCFGQSCFGISPVWIQVFNSYINWELSYPNLNLMIITVLEKRKVVIYFGINLSE